MGPYVLGLRETSRKITSPSILFPLRCILFPSVYLQLWFCSVISTCIFEAILWSHPSHRAETELLWNFGVSICSIGQDILKFSSVILLLQCPCWKRQYITSLSIYYRDMTCFDELPLKKMRSACSILGQNIDISFGPNGALHIALQWSTLRAASRSY